MLVPPFTAPIFFMKQNLPSQPGPIGVFDSGYGGLTVLNALRRCLPEYDYLYLGDNARAPYGSRSFDVVCEFTTQAVTYLFEQGCHLVILACNTASAKALRTIQQTVLPKLAPDRRVLGVIRPTAEVIGSLTHSRHVGVLATEGTIRSGSYTMEIEKLSPDITVTGHACPLWVPLVENNDMDSVGADYYVRRDIDTLLNLDPDIDAIILGCTHYPLLLPLIEKHVKPGVRLISQGDYVADALVDYLHRHPDMDCRCTKSGGVRFLTTDSADKFSESAKLFLGEEIDNVEKISLQ